MVHPAEGDSRQRVARSIPLSSGAAILASLATTSVTVEHARREQDVVAQTGHDLDRRIDAALPKRPRVRLRIRWGRHIIVLADDQPHDGPGCHVIRQVQRLETARRPAPLLGALAVTGASPPPGRAPSWLAPASGDRASGETRALVPWRRTSPARPS